MVIFHLPKTCGQEHKEHLRKMAFGGGERRALVHHGTLEQDIPDCCFPLSHVPVAKSKGILAGSC